MSGSASDRRRDTRYDGFLSFPGSQKLSTLGFPWARAGDDVRGVAEDVYDRLLSFDRGPSVFFDRSELKGDRYPDDLSKAVLQLRGGGVALVLLTAEYLRRKWCLAELHSFIQLHKLGKSTNRGSEAVVIRVVCLDTTANIKSALGDADVKDFVGEVGKFQWQSLEQDASESTRALVVNQICGHVLGYWNKNPSICLGREMSDCVYYLRDFFASSSASVSRISAALQVRIEEVATRESVFDQALQQGKLTAFNLDALSRATTDVDARKAMEEFRRKWVSDGWEWSIEPDKNDICLMRFVDKAGTALGNKSTSAGSEPLADPIAPLLPPGTQYVEYGKVDVFRPHLPDWQRMSDDLEASAATRLDQLKEAILPIQSGPWSTLRAMMARVSFFSDAPDSSSSLRRVVLTSVNGEGGVGKTSTCKLLCADLDIRTHFAKGAIVWIDVGQGATEEKVMGELERAVLNCGGERSAGLIRASGKLGAAVDFARSFFGGHRIFVVVDNVWATPGRVGGWTAELSSIATCSGSAVIMTTRFDSLCRMPGFHPVQLGRLRVDRESSGSPDWQIAENLFDKLVDAPPNEQSTDSYKKDRKKALEMSCGLPISIKTFACLVHDRMKIGEGVGAVLENIDRRASGIGLAEKFVGDEMEAVVGHPGLFAVMEENLAFLDGQKGRRVVSTALSDRGDGNGKDVRLFRSSYSDFAGLSLSSRYYALNMLPASSTSVSFPVLCRLWHLRDVDQVGSIVLRFVDAGLGRVEKESLGQNRSTRVFCLHDLQYEFCVGMRDASFGAMGDSGGVSPSTVDGHALLLSSCESLLDPEKDGDAIGMGWVSFCYAEMLGLPEQILRQYLSRNLLRHLCAVVAVMGVDSVGHTVCNLLSDFRWIRGRMAGDGKAAAVSDCLLALASRSGAGPRLLTGGAEASIRALQESLMLVVDGISRTSDGTLAGAMFQLAQSSVDSGDTGLDAAFFRKLASSTKENVIGAWLKPIVGCSRARRGEGVLAQAVVGSGARVFSFAALGDGVHFVSGSADGAVRVHDSGSLGPVLELSGHTGEVFCVAVAKEEGAEGSFLIFSGSDDRTVRSWKVGLDPVKGVVKEGSVVAGDCDSLVWCLAVSRGGDLVAAGCASGTIYIWKRREGDTELSFEPVANFRCAIAGEESGTVLGVAVSRSGDLVVAGEAKGGISFWNSGRSGREGTVSRYRASDESGADLWHVLLSEDEASVSFVFQKPAGCEVWDVASRRRRLPRVALPEFDFLSCATLSAGWEACAEGSGARSVLVAGGWDKSGRQFISLHSPSDDFKVSSTYSLASIPRSVCCTSFGGSKRILVGSDDGCVRMLDADVAVASDAAEPYEGGARSLGSVRSGPPDAPDLNLVWTVAFMPAAGLVVVGHRDGQFSLWRAETGEFIRSFEDTRGGWVSCVDFSADERLAVSGHGNSVALVWDASAWECRFALEGHSRPVMCATISADEKRIVTVEWYGELRLWDAEIGGAALLTIETGLEFSIYGSRGAISLDGGLFLWAGRDEGDRKWRCKVIDIVSGSVIWNCEEARHSDWDAFLKEMMSSEAFDGKEEVPWKVGAVADNQFVELPDDDSEQETADEWRVSSGDGRGGWTPRIDCALRSAEEETNHAVASLGFDSVVMSIGAGWMPREAGGRRCGVVACRLEGRSRPAIMHFYSAKE